jgi:hypothetical protein
MGVRREGYLYAQRRARAPQEEHEDMEDMFRSNIEH